MSCKTLFLCVSALTFVSFPASAHTLVSQSIQGTDRICVYGKNGVAAVPGEPQQVTKVGLAEPCPLRYRDGPSVASSIPEGARLVATRIDANRLICIYSSAGKTFEQTAAKGAFCSASR